MSTEELVTLSQRVRGCAEAAARAAGSSVHASFKAGAGVREKAGHQDVVTEADERAEQMIRAAIDHDFPGSTIVGEETGTSGGGQLQWFVDPIDGTSSYAAGLPFYCVSIGAAWDDKLIAGVIYDPERDEMFSGDLTGATLNGRQLVANANHDDQDCVLATGFPYEAVSTGSDLQAFGRLLTAFRGLRRLGSSALALAYVAAGRIDVASELNANPWDVAAGEFLVQSAGGRVFVDSEPPGNAEENAPRIWEKPRWVAMGPDFGYDESVLSRHISHSSAAGV